MADNVTLPGTGVPVASDEVPYSGDTTQAQIVQLAFVSGSEGSKTLTKVPGDSTNGFDVDVTRLPSLGVTTGKVTFTRANDTTAYTAGDVVGGAMALPGFAAGEILITSSSFWRDVAALIGSEGAYTLHLYSVTPPSALTDNQAWDLPSGDRDAYLGRIDLGTPVDLGSTLRTDVDQINKQVTAAGANLYAYLVTTIGYTPVALATYNVVLHGMKV